MDIHHLDKCPSLLKEGFDTYSPVALKYLFSNVPVSHILPFSLPNQQAEVGNADTHSAIENAGRLSLSGVQPKFGLILDSGSLRYNNGIEQSQYILKPKPTAYHILNARFCAANENLTMQMASQIFGIETAANGLCFFSNGESAYLTRRFDVNNGRKYAMEDFASLLGLTRANGGSDFKYINGSYEECADIIRKFVKSSLVDILRLFKLILFNFITLNDDAHLKNFSLLSNGEEYHLAPAYDLINTSLHIWEPRMFALEKGLFKEGMFFSDTKHISKKDFVEFGLRIGLPIKIVEHEITRFSGHQTDIDAMINRSFLSDELKNHYRKSCHYRQKLLMD